MSSDQRWPSEWLRGVLEVCVLRVLADGGARIGAALSDVESHCSQSGQSAQDAFGEPTEYARSLRLPVERDDWTEAMMRPLAPLVVQVVGMLVLGWSIGFSTNGQQLVIPVAAPIPAITCVLSSVMAVQQDPQSS